MTRLLPRLVLLLVAVPAVGLAGCAAEGPGDATPVPAEDDPVGRAWLDREPLPDCGTLDVRQGQRWRRADPEAWRCFADALESGGRAEVAVVYPTVEGDPIRSWYRLTGDSMEVYEDTSADAFGGGAPWLFHECEPPERLGRVIGCR